MKCVKNLLIITAILAIPIFASADQTTTTTTLNPCSPPTVKPEKTETRLGTIAVNPDIVQYGGLMTAQVTIGGEIFNVTIGGSDYLDVYDYSPKTLSDEGASAKAGNWTSGSGKYLPEGIYSVTYKAKKWTNYQWASLSYSATNIQGTGNGADNFYVYYDKIPIQLSLGTENQAPQSSKQVVRSIDIQALSDAKVNLKVDKGGLGKDISASSGSTLQVKSDSAGKALAFLFANEGDNVTFTASSPDSCQSSQITQSFKIPRSDIARTYTNNFWIWWLVGGILLLLLIIAVILIIKRRKKQDQNQSQLITPPMPAQQTPLQTQTQQEPLPPTSPAPTPNSPATPSQSDNNTINPNNTNNQNTQ